MAKKVAALVKLQLSAGQATPSPPVGPALGSVHWIRMGKHFGYHDFLAWHIQLLSSIDPTLAE